MEFYFSFGLQNGVVSLAVWRQHAHWCQSTWLTLDLLICEPWMQTLGAVDRVSLVPSQVVTVHRTVGRRRQTVLEGTGNDSEFCHFARICTFFYLKCRKCYRICLGVKKILYFFTWLRHMQCERRSDIRPWYLFLIISKVRAWTLILMDKECKMNGYFCIMFLNINQVSEDCNSVQREQINCT